MERDGHLALARAEAVTEHLRNTEDGVEQSWTFDRAPSGEGELRVRIPVEGLAFTGVTEGGLHFADPRTGLGFRYGHATWVEASGRKTPLQAEYIPGHILVRVPSGLLAASAYPAILDPIISPEQAMDTPVLAPASGIQYKPAAASNGTHYLVVWQDNRAGSNNVIYGARVTSAGEVVDTTGLRIATDSLRQYRPAVDSNGTDWFIVWEDDRNSTSSGDIYGARVSAAGVVLDSASLAISTRAGREYFPAVASNGTDWFVVWEDDRNSAGLWDIYGARVSAAGVVLDPAGLPLSTASNSQLNPAVGALGPDWLVAWDDYRNGSGTDIYGTRVSGAGAVLNPAGVPLSTASGSQSTNYLVVWEDTRVTNDRDIYGTRVTSAGEVVDPAGLLISAGASEQRAPAVAFDGANYLVAWEHFVRASGSLDLRGARVTSTGTLLEPEGFTLSAEAASESAVSVASARGQRSFVVYQQGLGSPQRVAGRFVSFTVSSPAKVVLNEILANEPGSNTAGEFVELVNVGGQPIDIGGWTVSDSSLVRHTFAAGTVLGAGRAIVVFGAASVIPAGLTNAVACTTGTLSLANGGDSVTVKSTNGTVIDTFVYTSELSGTDGVSMNRNPDLSVTGAFVLNTALSPQPSSAGKRVDGSGL